MAGSIGYAILNESIDDQELALSIGYEKNIVLLIGFLAADDAQLEESAMNTILVGPSRRLASAAASSDPG